MRHIFINFIPGSAGNFLSRFLQCIINNSHCWVESNNYQLTTLNEKIKILGYSSVPDYKTWVGFEHNLKHFSELHGIDRFSSQSTLIWISHDLEYDRLNQQNIIGVDDSCYILQISYKNKLEFEWITLNCIYKDSYMHKSWLESHQTNLNKSDVFYFDISCFFEWDHFKNHIILFLNHINQDYSIDDLNSMQNFYHDWFNTTLKFSEFEAFKKSLGWLL